MTMDEDYRRLTKFGENLDEKSVYSVIEEGFGDDGVSYVPLLAKKTVDSELVSRMSTDKVIDVLYRLYESPQYYQSEIFKIGRILSGRKDLFCSMVNLVESHTFKGDLYYWYPGVKHGDVLSFLCELFENVSEMFIMYVAKSSMMGQPISENVIEAFKKRIPMIARMRVDMILKDAALRVKYTQGCGLSTNIPITDKTVVRRMVVTHPFWTDKPCYSFKHFKVEQPVHKEISYSLCPCFSMVDVEFTNKRSIRVLTTLKLLESLIIKEECGKKFWIDVGLIDENWEYLI